MFHLATPWLLAALIAIPGSGLRSRVTTVNRPAFAAELARQRFLVARSTSELPADVRSAFERGLGGRKLEMAEPGQPYSFGCLIEHLGNRTLPRRRLVLAVINARFALMHYEEGGFATLTKAAVLARSQTAGATALLAVYTLPGYRVLSENELAQEIRSGELWVDAEPSPP